MVIVINTVIGGLSWVHLVHVWLADLNVKLKGLSTVNYPMTL